MAFAGAVVGEAAGAGVHRSGQPEPRSKPSAAWRRGRSRGAAFERDLSQARNHANADPSTVSERVVLATTGAHTNQPGVKNAGHAVAVGGLRRLLEGERPGAGGGVLGQSCFAGAGRADHQNVVTTGARDFQRAWRSAGLGRLS